MVPLVERNMVQTSIPQFGCAILLSFRVVTKINILPGESAALLTAHKGAIAARTFGGAVFYARTTFPQSSSLLCMRQTLVPPLQKKILQRLQGSNLRHDITLMVPS